MIRLSDSGEAVHDLELRTVLRSETRKAAEYFLTAAGLQKTAEFLEHVREHGVRNVKSLALALEAGDCAAQRRLLERQEILDAAICGLERLVPSMVVPMRPRGRRVRRHPGARQ